MSASRSSTPEPYDPVIAVRGPGLAGEVVAGHRPDDADAWVGLLDPAAARRTLHWGRNYLWVTDWPAPGGEVAVVVKQFHHGSARRRLDRRLRGSRAARSWHVARQLRAAGLPTPEPVAWLESTAAGGPAWYVCRHLEERFEARDFLRALNQGQAPMLFPDLSRERVIGTLANLARRLHDAGFWHRDYSAGNVLLRRDAADLDPQLVDLNRCRRGARVGLSRRLRDLCRMPFERREDQQALLTAYFGRRPRWQTHLLYRLYHLAFHGRHRAKRRVRGLGARAKGWLLPRGAHPHIPAAPAGVDRRDRAVWDRLSDQPHQHAGRIDKAAIRLRDAGVHLTTAATVARALPRVWRRCRRLRRELHDRPVPWGGVGVCVRPHPRDPAALLAALEGLAVRHVLLRLHPWEDDHDTDEELARELAARGHELVFALPQRRELVRDAARWRAKVEELFTRFRPYGRTFQVGQAINRSKWGVWNLGELQELAAIAAEVLRRDPEVEMVGPGVIDFEPHVTLAVLDWPRSRVRWDALASLLYVDRRGAPENAQAGFDTVGKLALLRAIAETSRWCAPRSWVTEVNWPLREGPHSPAGRDVAVSEEEAADYLARYYLLALASGLVERVYWWQLVARGYGLAVEEAGALRRRPAWHALATLSHTLAGSTFRGPLPAPPGAWLYRFAGPGGEVVAGWAMRPGVMAELPAAPREMIGRDGAPSAGGGSPAVTVGPAVRYFRLG